ncbi:MAG: GAF domain-containing protein [Synechococcaceae cyanobacterium SM2_3_1]|nr:GAF domain-containing protein [Synechococcaceae cyanobacterium SM2_3_1]
MSGALKAITAAISIYTALELIPLVPQILAVPSPAQLAQANQLLEEQVQQRQEAEMKLQLLNEALEKHVEQRTAALRKANDTLIRQTQRQQVIAELGQHALSGLPLKILYQLAIQRATQMLETDLGYILRKRPDHHLLLVAGIGWEAGTIDQQQFSSEIVWDNGYGLQAKDPVNIADLSRETRFQVSTLLQEHKARSGLFLPIHNGPDRFGVLGVFTRASRHFTTDDAHFLQAMAVILATAIERNQSESALKQHESRLRLALENSPVAMFSQNRELRYTWVYNPKHNTRTEDLLGKTDWEVMADENPHIIALKEKVLQTGESSRDKLAITLNGITVHYDFILEPIWENEEIAGLIGLAIDITEQQALERMKDEFLSVVSHELRTPLSSLHGSLQLLTTGRLGTLNPKGQRLVDIAVQNTDRLVRLVTDILDLERLESGKLEIRKTTCNAAELITQAIDTMQAMADEAGIRLTGCPQPIHLWADPDRILQVLTNLLSNAIKFSPRQSEVKLDVRYEWDQQVLFRVRDQGRGIPKNKLESIFERFGQVDASDSRRKGGTGLGLPICRTIVRQHGGRIWATSQVDQGSSFFFTLPLDPENQRNQIEPPTLMSSAPIAEGVTAPEAKTES